MGSRQRLTSFKRVLPRWLPSEKKQPRGQHPIMIALEVGPAGAHDPFSVSKGPNTLLVLHDLRFIKEGRICAVLRGETELSSACNRNKVPAVASAINRT